MVQFMIESAERCWIAAEAELADGFVFNDSQVIISILMIVFLPGELMSQGIHERKEIHKGTVLFIGQVMSCIVIGAVHQHPIFFEVGNKMLLFFFTEVRLYDVLS